MKKRMIPVVALSALICLGGLSAITSCSSISDGGTQEPVGEVKVTITSTISKVKVGETVTLTCSVTGTNDTAVTWSVNAGAEYLEVVDASKGEFKGLAIGSAKVKVSLVADPTKSAIVSITVTAATDVDPDALVTIESITKTKDSAQFAETTIQGTLVSLYAEGTAYSGLIYDGTAVMPLFKFASKTDAEKLKIGDVLKVKGKPSRYKDYYWAQMDGSGSNITSFNVVEGATKNELPAAVNWTGADSAAYTESDSTDFKHVICDVIAVKSGTYTNFKIIGSSDTDRLLGLQYTPSDAPYVAEGTKSRMEFVTGDLKNSETIVSMYPINIELIGYSLSAESTDIKVGETTKLTLSNAGTAVTEGITWASSDETIATVANGVVTGVKEGKATITATVGTESATLDINVLPKIVDYTSEATTKTIAECNAEAGDESKLYIVEGKISEVKNAGYGSFYMTADGNAATGDDALYVYGSCFGQEALSFAGSKWSYNYKNGYAREDFYTVGQTVKILCFRVDYNGTKEVKGVILTEDPYWLAKKATVDEVLEGDLDASKLYFTEAYVTSIEKISYGRFHASANNDGTGKDLYVFSSGFYNNVSTALSKKDDGSWNYDFNKATAPTETSLTVGDKVTLVAYRADFNGTKEVKGVIYDIEAGELKQPAEEIVDTPERYSKAIEYDFTNLKTSSQLDAAGVLSAFNSVLSEESTKIIDSVKDATYIYNGNPAGGPGDGLSCIKFGKSGKAGSLTFTTSANIGKIEFTYHPWSASKDTTIAIGDKKITHKANDGFATPVVDSIAFESTKEVTISTETAGDPRACVLKLKLYVVAE